MTQRMGSSLGPFTLRWDDSMGCYRVSVPELRGPIDVIAVAEVLEFIEHFTGSLWPAETNTAAEVMREAFISQYGEGTRA